MDPRMTTQVNALTLLRLKVIGAACLLGAATAFLTFTATGTIVLLIALVVAAALALWLWRTRPQLFTAAAEHLKASHSSQAHRIVRLSHVSQPRTPGTATAKPANATNSQAEREPATSRVR